MKTIAAIIAITPRTMPIAKPALAPAEVCPPECWAWAEWDGVGEDGSVDIGGVKFP